MTDIPYGFEVSSFYFNAEDYEGAACRVKRKSRFKNKVLRFLIVALIAVLAFQFVFYFLILPSFSNAKFIFSGEGTLTEAELKIIAGIGENTRWAKLDSSVISKRLVSYPLIKSASVRKKFPDTVYIETVERKAVAVAFAVINGKTTPMEIDKDGVVFKIGSENCAALTIVSGLHFKNPKAGMRVNSFLRPLFVQIDTLMKKNPLLLSGVSEIQIQEKKYGGYDLIVYHSQIPISVVINNVLNENSLRYVFVLVDVAGAGGVIETYGRIDARGKNAVYINREASDE